MDRRKVLIIDDEVDLCHLLRGYFIRKNYEVHLSHTLDQGLTILHTLKPDIVFLDNNLPDGTGWDVAAKIATEFPDVHVNMVSAFNPAVPEMPATAKFTIIEKPISLTDLERQFSIGAKPG